MLAATLNVAAYVSIAFVVTPISQLVVLCLSVSTILLYIAFQCYTLAILARVAWDARMEARHGAAGPMAKASAARALSTVALLVASAETTAFHVVVIPSSITLSLPGTFNFGDCSK